MKMLNRTFRCAKCKELATKQNEKEASMNKDGGAAFQVWECKIVVPHDVILPQGFDHPPRFAAMSAVEKAGVPIMACFSGWNGKLSIHQIRAMKYKAKLLLAEDAEMEGEDEHKKSVI
jgi:hypothetical protein